MQHIISIPIPSFPIRTVMSPPWPYPYAICGCGMRRHLLESIPMPCNCSRRCWITLYKYVWQKPEVSMKWVGCLNHNLTYATSVEPTHSPSSSSMTQHKIYQAGLAYDHWPQYKVLNHIIYVWQSLMWVWSGWWGAAIIIQNLLQVVRSWGQVLSVRPSIYQAGLASLWSLATVDGAETLYKCITKTWAWGENEAEAEGVPQS
jgi:hypothetical protein